MIKKTRKSTATPSTSSAVPVKTAASTTSVSAAPKVAVAAAAPKTPSAVKATPTTAAERKVSLELVKPGAKKVYVAGSFNAWQPERTPLAPRDGGRWVGDLAVNPGRHEYLFVVDGQWLPDPNAKESVSNPFGGVNSVLTVSA